MTSMSDGSSSTIMVEEWQPIFDRFDLESDGKMVGDDDRDQDQDDNADHDDQDDYDDNADHES